MTNKTERTRKEKREAVPSRGMEKTKAHVDNTLVIFLNEINRIPILSREEEKQTARDAAAGNKAAREKLINANLRFVVSIAKKYQGLGLSLEDLIAEGNIGLVNAVDRFDVGKNYRFISYAVWWIRQAILSALCEKSRMIRLPSNRAAELVKIEQARKLIKKQISYEQEIEEIAQMLNMKEKHISNLLNISREMISLDANVSAHRDLLLKDYLEDTRYVSPDISAEYNLLKADIENALSTLDKDEADIIRCHFGLGRRAMSLKEIGAQYHLSKERVRQIEVQALRRLQHPNRKRRLRVYVA